MQSSYFLASLFILLYYVTLPPFVAGLSHEDAKTYKNKRDSTHMVINPKMAYDIAVHGILLWVSMGFLMPLGILAIRMSHREEGRRRKLLFYLHLILQVLAVILATAGAIMSIKSFENSFNNNHQRIGVALYGVIWVQAVVGFLRPHGESKRRRPWYFVHWILGTIISVVGTVSIYTGLNAYHEKTSTSTSIWTILFTAQVSVMALSYIFQDKWEYLKKQGGNINSIEALTSTLPTNQISGDRQMVLVVESCGKKNALQNLTC